MLRYLAFIGFSLIFAICFGQDNAPTKMYFGAEAGIDLSYDPPRALTDGVLDSKESSGVICDKDGNLLFYTDGIKAWNKDHQIIEGADNLGGTLTGTQSGLIIPNTTNENDYYIFSISSSRTLLYSIIDMSENGGLGKVISSNNILAENVTEKLTAIISCDESNIWLIGHEFGTNNYLLWSIKNGLITATPSVFSIGKAHPDTPAGGVGQMKASLDGSLIASAVHDSSFVELVHFDPISGKLYDAIIIEKHPELAKPYGIEFSPSGSYLYFTSDLPRGSKILQVDVKSLLTTDSIFNLNVVAESSLYNGALQLLPSGQIIVAKGFSDYLSMIRRPENFSTNSEFIENAIDLGGRKSLLGLPQIPSIYFLNEFELSVQEISPECTPMPVLRTGFNNSDSIILFNWYFNDSRMPNEYDYTIEVGEPGLYKIEAQFVNSCGDTSEVLYDSIFIEINYAPKIDSIIITDTNCNLNTGRIEIFASSLHMPLTYGSNRFGGTVYYDTSSVINDLYAREYRLEVKDSLGCISHDTATVKMFNPVIVAKNEIYNTSCNLNNGSIELTVTGGVEPYNYTLNSQEIELSQLKNLGPGRKFIRVFDSQGCSDYVTITIDSSDEAINLLREITPATCNKNSGTLRLDSYNMQEPLQYVVNGISYDTSYIDNLPAGVLDIYITDLNGCIDTVQAVIPEIKVDSISRITATSTKCGKNNGQIQVEIQAIDLTYSINDSIYDVSTSVMNTPPGDYLITSTDKNGCETTYQVTINESTPLLVNKLTTEHTSCGFSNGSVSIFTNREEELTFLINGLPSNDSGAFEDLSPATYQLRITDSSGCTKDTFFTINDSEKIELHYSVLEEANCINENGALAISLNRSLDSTDIYLESALIISDTILEGLEAGRYSFTIETNDGCTLDTFITVPQSLCLKLPNIFSPNGDNINDEFHIKFNDYYRGQLLSLEVFDRYGNKVCNQSHKENELVWNGRFNGMYVQNGVYVYVISYMTPEGLRKLISGDITVAR